MYVCVYNIYYDADSKVLPCFVLFSLFFLFWWLFISFLFLLGREAGFHHTYHEFMILETQYKDKKRPEQKLNFTSHN